MLNIKPISAAVISAMLIAAPANANVGTGMQTWFDSMGGFSNVTPPNSYKGQTQNGYSGGGAYLRTPILPTAPLVTFTPPSLDIGCGGIDFTAGAFSHINAAALTNLLTNVGTTVTYAFLLAIKSSMPEMASLFEYLQDVAAKANAMNKNACQAMEGIHFAPGVENLSKNVSAAFSQTAGATYNGYADGFAALKDTISNWPKQKAVETAAIAAGATTADQLYAGNVVWKLLNRRAGMDKSDREFIMSLTGTIIVDEATKKWDYRGPTGIKVEALVGYDAGPTENIPIFQCGVDADCLNPSTSTVSTPTFLSKVSAKIDALKTGVITRTAQDSSALKLIDVSSVPVWKMIALSSTYSPSLVDKYKRMIAVDVAHSYLSATLMSINTMLSTDSKMSLSADAKEAIKEIKDNLEKTIASLDTQKILEYAKIETDIEIERQLQLLQQSMNAGIPAQAFNSMSVFN